MNTLEFIGLATLVWVLVKFFLLPQHEERVAIKKSEQSLELEPMFIAYRLGLRLLYKQHEDNDVRERLIRLARSYGGIHTLNLELSDEEYIESIKTNNITSVAYGNAKDSIEKRGYPLDIIDDKIINRWNNDAVIG